MACAREWGTQNTVQGDEVELVYESPISSDEDFGGAVRCHRIMAPRRREETVFKPSTLYGGCLRNIQARRIHSVTSICDSGSDDEENEDVRSTPSMVTSCSGRPRANALRASRTDAGRTTRKPAIAKKPTAEPRRPPLKAATHHAQWDRVVHTPRKCPGIQHSTESRRERPDALPSSDKSHKTSDISSSSEYQTIEDQFTVLSRKRGHSTDSLESHPDKVPSVIPRSVGQPRSRGARTSSPLISPVSFGSPPNVPRHPRPLTVLQKAAHLRSSTGSEPVKVSAAVTPKTAIRKTVVSLGKKALSVANEIVNKPQGPVLPDKLPVGSLLVFNRAGGLYQHLAIFIGDNKVVHLTGVEDAPRKVQHVITSMTVGSRTPRVQIGSLDEVLGKCSSVTIGDEHYHRVLGKPYPAQAVVQRALSQVGCPGYQLAVNNCEHFATWAKFGVGYSTQSNQPFKALPLSCPSDASREDTDERTEDHLHTERFDWVLVLEKNEADEIHSRDVELQDSHSFPGRRFSLPQPVRTTAVRRTLGVASRNTQDWLITHCDTQGRLTAPRDTPDLEIVEFRSSTKDTVKAASRAVQGLTERRRRVVRLIPDSHRIVILHMPMDHDRPSYNPHLSMRTASSISGLRRLFRKSYQQKERSFIFDVAFYNGFWLTLSRTDPSLLDQCILLSKKFPERKCTDFLQSGYRISCLAAGDYWVVAMDKSRNSHLSEQTVLFVQPGEGLPRTQIRKYWSEGYSLRHATGN